MQIPRAFVRYTWDSDVTTDSGERISQISWGGFAGGTVDVKVDSFFHEAPKGNGNNVCHVKLTNLTLLSSDNISKDFVIAFGNYWRRSRTTQARIRAYIEYPYHFKTYVYFEYGATYKQWIFQYDCAEGRYNGSKYQWHYAEIRSVWRWQGSKWIDSGCTSSGVPTSVRDLFASTVLGIFLTDRAPGPPSPSLYYDGLYEEYASYIEDNVPHAMVHPTNGWNNAYWGVGEIRASLPSAPLDSALLLDEDTLLVSEGISFDPYAAAHIKAARQEAYLDALDHIPSLNDNSIANVLEIVSFLKALIIDHRVEIPSSLQSLWLSYRYVYNTGKSDIEEAVNFMSRHVTKEVLQAGISCYGKYVFDFKGTSIMVKCRLTAKQKEMEYLQTIWSALYRYGLSPSFYVIWDMIPYSFIVDWFIPVGDILKGYDMTTMYEREYEITDLWYSISYNVDLSGSSAHAYTRWNESSPAEFNGYYSLINKGTVSNKTIGFRILDAMSILIR